MRIGTFTGIEVAPHLPAVAALRIAVFRDWPYLYDGTPEYEASYLETYARSPESLFVLAFDGERVVGASTGIPLAHEGETFRLPFADPASVFYFGESVLLHEYRGRGIGHRFFDEREAFARRLGRFACTAFAAVDRDAHDARRPAGYRGNEDFWIRRGYARQPGMTMHLSWREVHDAGETEKPLTFWLRPLEPSR